MAEPTEQGREDLWTRLRHRKLVQWGITYAAAAWTLLQVIEYLGETYSWPPGVRQVAVPLLTLGSLVALVLAWYHGDKGDQSVSRPELATLALVVAFGGGMLWWYVSRLDESVWDSPTVASTHAVPTDGASVAVLPFVNMSSDPEQEYFSDGLSEEILNALAVIPGLYVPSRTSSFQFKGKTGDVAKFAEMLGVAAILEGSVRKSGNRVRVSAQLINAADGFHIWSQTYDRELDDIFAIQADISNSIAEALEIRLTARQKLAVERTQPTTNMAAYEQYLLGRFELNKRRPEAVAAAIAHFEEAVALDPQFADAYADMSLALSMTGKEYLPTAEEDVRSRRYLEKALAIAPERAAVLAAAGFRAFQDARLTIDRFDDGGELKPDVRAQMERALDYLERALAAYPNNAEVFRWRQGALRELGRAGSVFEAGAEALKRDPLSIPTILDRIHGLDWRGRRAEAAPLLERLASLDPPSNQQVLADFAFKDGDYIGGVRHLLMRYDLETGIAYDVVASLGYAFAVLGLRAEAFNAATQAQSGMGLASVYYGLGDFRKAADEIRPGISAVQWAYGCALGHALYLVGDFAGTDSAFDLCWSRGVPSIGVGGARLVMAADAARRLGKEDKARRYMHWLEKSFKYAVEQGIALNHFLLAEYYAYEGRWDEAATELAAAVTREDFWLQASHMALMGDLPRRPEYLEAVRKRKAELERQRVGVLNLLCGPNPVSKTYKPAAATCAQLK